MPAKAASGDFPGRFREIVADPLNLLIRRHPEAGTVTEGRVVLHNGHLVPVSGPGAYYGAFSDILVINRGVHEPLEEYVFQEVLGHLPQAPRMLELGAYWGHYSMWLKQVRPAARVTLVEAEPPNAAAGRANFAANGYEGRFIEARVGTGGFGVDAYLGGNRLDILHSDIQGHEAEMLEGAARTLAEARVEYWFVSTHSQGLHREIERRLVEAGYRIEISADFEAETTSFDGFVLAVHPDRPPVFTGAAPLGRCEIAAAPPRTLVESLLPRLSYRRVHEQAFSIHG